ncbi:MAG: DUF935 family protein [Alphaproteobacteria bacterium]|jgi:phage gp29-like protein|nr:DUF935 family protein [Alphaproteobacteria bacterium]
MLLDQHGRPLAPQTLSRAVAGPTLAGVRSVYADHPSQNLDPRKLGAILREAEEGDPTRFLELAEDLEEKDGHYAAVLRTRKLAVAELDLSVVAAGEEADDLADADLLRAWLDTGLAEGVLADLLDGLGKGFAVAEILWETVSGTWRPAALEPRDPRWFAFDPVDGRTLKLRQADGSLADLPPAKFVVHAPQLKSGLPIRGGLARPAAWAWLFKSFALKDWMIFAETYAMPLRLGKYPAGSSEDDRQALMRAVADLGADAAAVIPAEMVVEFVKAEGAGGSAAVYQELCEYMDRQVSKLVLGQTTTTDAISGGHAVSREHNEVRHDIARADARQLAATLTRDLAGPMIALNRGPGRTPPRFRLARPEREDVGRLVDWTEKLVALGVAVPAWWLRDKIGAPEAAPGEALLQKP